MQLDSIDAACRRHYRSSEWIDEWVDLQARLALIESGGCLAPSTDPTSPCSVPLPEQQQQGGHQDDSSSCVLSAMCRLIPFWGPKQLTGCSISTEECLDVRSAPGAAAVLHDAAGSAVPAQHFSCDGYLTCKADAAVTTEEPAAAAAVPHASVTAAAASAAAAATAAAQSYTGLLALHALLAADTCVPADSAGATEAREAADAEAAAMTIVPYWGPSLDAASAVLPTLDLAAATTAAAAAMTIGPFCGRGVHGSVVLLTPNLAAAAAAAMSDASRALFEQLDSLATVRLENPYVQQLGSSGATAQ